MASYKIRQKIAAGGMAEVFLAVQTGVEGFEKPVAIKRVLPTMTADRAFTEMFLREAKLTVALQHGNVVQVLDLGTASGQYFMVLEFVDGENLRTLLKTAARSRISLPLREGVFIVQQVAEALAYAHERIDAQRRPLNIVHRDINPSNVMVGRSGEVKLADFGIAKATSFNAGTEVGVVKGKVGYLSPEQVKGSPADQRSDLFLMGLLLYELLNDGKPLFPSKSGNYFETVQTIARFDPKGLRPPPGVPPQLWSIVNRALMPDPSMRYQRARDFAEALSGFLFQHRMRVGNQDIAALFAKIFKDRKSPLELQSGAAQELKLEKPVMTSPSGPPRATPPPLPAVKQGSDPLGMPVVPAMTATTNVTPPSGSGPLIRTRELTPVTSAAKPDSTVATGSIGPDNRLRLGEQLIARGKLDPAQLERALRQAAKVGARLGEVLVAEGLVPEDEVIRAVATQHRTPFVTASAISKMAVPPPEVLAKLAKDAADRLRALPLGMNGRELLVALENPTDLLKLDAVKFAVGVPVKPLLVGERALRLGIRRFYYGEDPAPEWEDPQAFLRAASEASKMRFADRCSGTREQLFGEEDLKGEPEPAEGKSVEAAAPATDSNGRSLMIVADDERSLSGVTALLSSQGFTVTPCSVNDCLPAVKRGQFELVLVFAEWVKEAEAVANHLRDASATEVRLIDSASKALIGEDGANSRQSRILTRLLDTACSVLGDSASSAALIARIAERVTLALGGSSVTAERSRLAAYAVALANRASGKNLTGRAMPTGASLRALLGGDAAEYRDLLASCDAPRLLESMDPSVLAIWAGTLFTHKLGGGALSPDKASAALVQLREEKRLPPRALEALAAVAAETVLAAGAGATIALLSADSSFCAAVQTRLLADGMGVKATSSAAVLTDLLKHGVNAVVASHGVTGVDVLALTRGLRAAAATQTLPIFLIAPTESTDIVEPALDAGADDVLLTPVPPDVLAAKLRRILSRVR